MTYHVINATPPDHPIVMQIMEDASLWVIEKGIHHQWQYPLPERKWQRMAAAIEAGEVYKVIDEAGTIVAIFRLTLTDSFWQRYLLSINPDEPPDTEVAVYLHSFSVQRRWHGQGIGSFVLEWAKAYTRALNRPYLRLDCLATNAALCAYYESQGCIRRSTYQDRDYSGAMYEIPVGPI